MKNFPQIAHQFIEDAHGMVNILKGKAHEINTYNSTLTY
jgi:hypothetical protein